MKYTRTEDSKIRAELLKIERELAGRPGSWPLPDEHGEVQHFPSLGLKREYVAPCGHKIRTKGELLTDLSHDKRFLLVENAQLRTACAQKAIEAYREKRARLRAESDVVIVGLAGIALLVITILGMRL